LDQTTNAKDRSGRKPGRLIVLLCVGGMLIALVWMFRAPLRHMILEQGTLSNSAPPPELVREMIRGAPNPAAALVDAWNSGRIVHRQVAIRALQGMDAGSEPLSTELESLLLSAALDPDMNVRETAFAALKSRDHPALSALAAVQLQNCDPQIRALGLSYLNGSAGSVSGPLAAGLLDDPDLRVVGMSLKLLEKLSGEEFGSRLSDTVQVENKQTGLKEYQPEGSATTAAAVTRAKAWWDAHREEFPPADLPVPAAAHQALQRVPAGDFQLRTLEGRTLRLSDLRGKVVLVNFWTTWCPACVGEMPALNALQAKNMDQLVILGVSLDYVPDSHGHIGGHAAVEEQARSDGHHDDQEEAAAALQRVREKVVRTVSSRGVTYPILLDEENDVGGQFNGGELPTTVIIDPEGYVRRRFIGVRSLPVFEAMVHEATAAVDTSAE